MSQKIIEWMRNACLNMFCLAEMSGLWNFSVRVQSWSNKIESDPALIRKVFENHQSDPVLIRPCKITRFYFASWGKSILELFYLYPHMIGWGQNSSSSAFASWGKIDTVFWDFQNLTSQCLFCHQRQTDRWSYFAIRRMWLLD